MMINYCNEAQVASALGLNPTTTLSAQANAGATSLTVQSGTFYNGQRIALDHFADDTVGEVVQIKSVNGNTLQLVNPTQFLHDQGAPVIDVTAITKVIASASRMVDSITYYTDVGFNQETRTESRPAIVQNDGTILVSAQKPLVQSVTSLTIQNTPLDSAVTIPLTNLVTDKYFVIAYPLNTSFIPPSDSRNVRATLIYSGGYSSIPDEIVRATIVFAARFYKEKDSGFSDTIGNSDLGIVTYKKGVPNEVLQLLKPHIRVTP